MSREIKFRAWNNHLNVMTNDVHKLDSLNEYISKENYILMQYTGLKDKNGKEVYEEDIIKIYYKEPLFIGTQFETKKEKERIDIVEWDEGSLSFELTGNILLGYKVELVCEIIGNIYENPDSYLESI